MVSTRWRTKPVKEDVNGGIDTETEHQAFRFQLAQRKKPAKVEQRLKPNHLQILVPPFV
jgi:type III secretory pathway component EscR